MSLFASPRSSSPSPSTAFDTNMDSTPLPSPLLPHTSSHSRSHQLSTFLPQSHRHERIALGIPALDTRILSYEDMGICMQSILGMGWKDVLPVLGRGEKGEERVLLGARRKVASW